MFDLYNDWIYLIEGKKDIAALVSQQLTTDYKGTDSESSVVTADALAWLALRMDEYEIDEQSFVYGYTVNIKEKDGLIEEVEVIIT